MKNVIDFLIDDFHERALPELVRREKLFVKIPRKANVVIGMRRSGKTWYCYQQILDLLAEGVEKRRLIYLNFEDDRLLPFVSTDFQIILDTYYRKFPDFKDVQCYLFLDEVQRIEGWEKFVRRVLDTENISVCVTGSSSRLLSTEIATSLRGRSLTIEIFPFSFREFLKFHRINIKESTQFGSRIRGRIQHMAEKYLKTGGFPEVQSLTDELHHQVLRNYLDVVILRDVVERYRIGNTGALRALIRHVISAPATRFSINKFYNSLRSQGVTCTKNNLYDFLDYLADVFLFYQVPIHSRSEKIRQVNPKKVYVIDQGLINTMSYQITGSRGAHLENLVYIHLRRQGIFPEYYITKSGTEIDFILTRESSGQPQLIQVCWDLSDLNTKKREVQGLLSAMEELRIMRGTIITWLDEDVSDTRIEIIPAWKWLLYQY